jgi:hypothetical protein
MVMVPNALFRKEYKEDIALGEGTEDVLDHFKQPVTLEKFNASHIPLTQATDDVLGLDPDSNVEDGLLKLKDEIDNIPPPTYGTLYDTDIMTSVDTSTDLGIANGTNQNYVNKFLNKKINESSNGGGLKEALYLKEADTFDYMNWATASIAEGSYFVVSNAIWIAKNSAWDTSAYSTVLDRNKYLKYMKDGDILSFNRLSDKKYIEIAVSDSVNSVEEGVNVYKVILGIPTVGTNADLVGNISLHNTKINTINSSGEVGNAGAFYNNAVNADGEITSTDWEQLDVWDGINDSGDDTIVGDKIEYDRSTHVFRNISGGDIQVNVGFSSSMIITTDVSVNVLEFGLLNQAGVVLCSSTNRTDQSGAVTIPQTSQVNKVLSSSNIITMVADDEISLYVRKPYNFGIQLDYTTYDSSITIIEIVGAGKDGLPGPIGATGPTGKDGVDGSGDMMPVSYRLSAYVNSAVTPNTGEVTIQTGVGYTLRFNRYDSRGLDNDVSRKYSFFNDVVVGNPLLLVDTITARGYTANEVGSISCIVTSVEYSGDILIVTTDNFDVTGGQSISDIVGRVFVLISAHQLGGQLDEKVDKPIQSEHPSSNYGKICGMKLDYGYISSKVPNNGDTWTVEFIVQLSTRDSDYTEDPTVTIGMRFNRDSDRIWSNFLLYDIKGNADKLYVRQFIKNHMSSAVATPIDVELLKFEPLPPDEYNLTVDCYYEYNFYINSSHPHKGYDWYRIINESELGLVNDTPENTSSVYWLRPEDQCRCVKTIYNDPKGRREHDIDYINAYEILVNGYVKAAANPSSLLFHNDTEDLTVSDILYASPTSASIEERYGNDIQYIGGHWVYVGIQDVRCDIEANVSYSATGTNTEANLYISKNWTEGDPPSAEDLDSQRDRKTSGAETAAISVVWSGDLSTGDTVDFVMNKEGASTETITILSGTYKMNFVQWL